MTGWMTFGDDWLIIGLITENISTQKMTMTRPVLRAAGALLFFSTLPALAAVPAKTPASEAAVQTPPARVIQKPARPVKPAPSPLAIAIKAAAAEITERPASVSYAQWLDTLPGFRFSPATSKLLMQQLGTSRPFTVKRQAAPDGVRTYVFTAPALRHNRPDGGVISWDAMTGSARVESDGVTLHNQFSAPRITVEDKMIRFDARDIAASGTSKDPEMLYGEGGGTVGNFQVTTKADGSTVAMDGLFARFASVDQGATVGWHYDAGIHTLTAGGERLDDLHLAVNLNGLDKAALENFVKMSKKFKAEQSTLAKLPPKVVSDDFVMPMLRQFGAALTAQGAAIELDDLSFSYHGNKARMHGQVHMENVTPADLDQPIALFKKAAGHFDVAVPVAMLHALAENVARKQLAKQQPGADAAAVAKMGDMVYDSMLKGALSAGYVRIDGDTLVTTVDIKDGALLLNGKPVQMPKPTPPVAAVESSPGTMRARRIADKCTLPDYPAEIIKGDRALSLALQMRINEDGTVEPPVMARSSGIPAYDTAVLAAAAHCTYIPALRDGKPVAVSEVWEIVRVPGTPRP